MRIAFLSDIHANREALEACLARLRERGCDRLVFLGDYVGYGADPEWVIDMVAEEVAGGAIAIRGNHDDAISAPLLMNPIATAAITWTRPRLSAAQRAFLAGLPLTAEEGDRLYVHASADRPARWNYILDRDDARFSFAATERRITLCGHVHVPQLYREARDGGVAALDAAPGRAVPLEAERRWLAVIGAVGQPRDGLPAAHCALLDTGRAELSFLRVPYDVASAARKIRERGLPEALASRLERGL